MVQGAPGSIPLDHYSFHITQVVPVSFGLLTSGLTNLARLLMTSEAAKFVKPEVGEPKLTGTNCVVCQA